MRALVSVWAAPLFIAMAACGASDGATGTTSGSEPLGNRGDAVLGDAPSFGNLDVGRGGQAADTSVSRGSDVNADADNGHDPDALLASGPDGDNDGGADDSGTSAVSDASACVATDPPEEVCDGVDNDCDGEVDNGSLCGDGDVCTSNTCVSAKCTSAPLNCDDGQDCTADSCAPTTGCSNVAAAGACDDNNACTDDTCDAKSGCTNAAKLCDDNNPCTADACDLATGCTGTEKDCDDGNPCTQDGCVVGTGACDHGPAGNGTPCDDGDLCTVSDSCAAGVCGSGGPKECVSGDDCLLSKCDAKSGECGNEQVKDGALCNDGDACTSSDVCGGGVCNGTKVSCDDKDPCTVDLCDPKAAVVNVGDTGCVHKPGNFAAPCDDANACTSADVCVANDGKSTCAGGKTKTCDDGKPCTADSCDKTTGVCSNGPAAAGTKCDDGSLCTLSDKCVQAGKSMVCKGSAVPCADTNPCTADSCNAKTGACSYKPGNLGKPCDDSDVCTTGSVCKDVKGSGVCSGKPKVCDDGDLCTDDSCVAKTGACAFSPIKGCTGAACNAWTARYGNEEEAPVYSTSTEYLYAVDRSVKYGGSFAVGYVASATSATQGLVVRRDDSGKKLWAKQIGGTKSDFLRGVAVLADGTAIAVGNNTGKTGSYYDGWMLRLSNTGTVLSNKQFGGGYYDYFFDVERFGTGVVACGYRRTSSSGSAFYRPWVVYTDANAAMVGLKERLLADNKAHFYIRGCAVDAANGTVILAGYQSVSGKSNEGVLATVSKSGLSKHVLVPGGTSSDLLYDVVSLGNGLIAAAGQTYASGTGNQGWLVRASLGLTGIAQFKYGASGTASDAFNAIAAISSKRVVLAGNTSAGPVGGTDGWLLTADIETGKVNGYDSKFGSPKTDYLYGVAADSGGHVLAVGRTSESTNYDTWQVRVGTDGKPECSGCSLYDVRYGNELEDPKYTTSSEYLYDVNPAKVGGGSYAAGNVFTGSQNGMDGLVVRRSDDGKKIWAKHYHKSASDYVRGVVPLAGGGGVFVGYTQGVGSNNRDGWAVGFDDKGGQKWSKTFGGAANDYFHDAAASGNYVVACGYRRLTSTSQNRPWVVWLDANGNKVGLKERLLTVTGDAVQILGCDVDSAGTVILAGYGNVSGKSNEPVLATVTKTGVTKVVRAVGATGSETLQDVVALNNGWIAAVGSRSVGGTTGNEGLLLRATTSLTSIAQWTYGSGSNSKSELFSDVTRVSGTQIAVAGYWGAGKNNSLDGWILGLNPLTGGKTGLDAKYGGDKTDLIHSIAANADGTLLAAGQSYGVNGDTWQLKVDAKGGLCPAGTGNFCTYWDQKKGLAWPTNATYDSHEYVWGIAANKSGSVQVGYARDSKNGYQGVALARDTYGKEQWTVSRGGSASDYLRGVAANPDGSWWTAGYSYSDAKGSADAWLLKLSATGAVQKELKVGGTKYDAFFDADTDEKGGVIVAGYRDLGTGNGNDAWVAWYDANGVAKSWTSKVFGGAGSQYLYAVDYDPKSGQTFAAGSKYVTTGNGSEAYVVRISSAGTSITSRTWEGSGSEVLYGIKVHPTYGYVFGAGYSTSGAKGGADGFVVRTTNSFGSPTQKLIGTDKADYFYDVAMAANGNLVGVGYTTGATASIDGWIREFSWASLTATGATATHGVKSVSDYFYAIASTSQGYVVGGRSNAKSADTDSWTMSVDNAGKVTCQ